MPREFQFQVSPEVAANENLLAQHVAKLFQVSPKEIQKVEVLKRSIAVSYTHLRAHETN
jgi:hypothetical protein